MGFFDDDLRAEYKSVYSQFMSSQEFKEAKVYHGGKSYDLTKRWYVYYSFYNPETEKMERQTPITWGANRKFKTKTQRLAYLNSIKNFINRKLKEGWIPRKIREQEKLHTSEVLIDYAFNLKSKEIKQTTFEDYNRRINDFKKYLARKGVLKLSIENINKKHVIDFLKKYEGANNYNNGKFALNSIFKILSNEGYIKYNFIKEILNRKAVRKPIKLYSLDEISKVEDKLSKYSKTLLMYVRMESYMFFRPIELVRIKKDDIDFNKRTISVETKTNFSKTKLIPEILIKDLIDFCKDKEGFIFEPENTDWNETEETNRRGYYTKQFKKFRKLNNVDFEFKMYHFRHFYITKIYSNLRKEFSKEESIKKLSLITGHSSKAIFKYILVNDLELPEDYSNRLK